MTLGGLALVLGRVVDDSVVDVENTVRHLHMGKTPFQAALDSANEIAVPVLMATVTTVIVFLPLVLLSGMGKYLFTPLAVSVALALFASYIVSRTVSPLLCAKYLRAHGTSEARERFPRWLLLAALVLAALGGATWIFAQYFPPDIDDWPRRERQVFNYGTWTVIVAGAVGAFLVVAALLFPVSPAFDRGFERATRLYESSLAWALHHRVLLVVLVAALVAPAFLAFRATGQELFPDVDSSEFTVHLRAAGGPRVEETERQVGQIENMIRGYRASAEELGREVARSRLLDDQEHLAAIRAANPEDGALIDQMLGVARDRGSLERLARAHADRTFAIPGVVPPEDFGLMLSNVGLSSRWSAIYTPNNGPHAAFIRVQLRSGFAGRSTPTIAYVDRLRDRLKLRYPTHDFFFETGGMIRRILNSGALAPIEVQVGGRDHEFRREITRTLHRQISSLASVHDAHSPQSIDLPQLSINVDRTRAVQSGLTESDVVRNVIVALMSSAQIAPNFWIDPSTGNPYVIGVQYPEYAVAGIRTLEEIPVTGGPRSGGRGGSRIVPGTSLRPPGASVVRLEDVATIERGMGPVEVYHYAANRVSQLFVSVADRDLAGVASDVEGLVRRFPLHYALGRLPQDRKGLLEDRAFHRQLDQYLREREARTARKLRANMKEEHGVDPESIRLPRGVTIQVHGEIQSMRHSFQEMGMALALAVLLVYLVMAAQFASWLDPLIMIVSAPLGLIGVAFTLWGTDTSLNIQSCMGVLMMVGISVSNSVLVVEFANRQRESGMGIRDAIITASCVRLRPILMTTLATLVGLAPMAIHLHPGDEMNLPLARAVIGGLAGSTLLTLYVVPLLYYMLKPRHGPVVTLEGHGLVSVDAPPPSDPAATFMHSMPVSDWGETVFPFPGEGGKPDAPARERKPDAPAREEGTPPAPRGKED
jgi:multidrug efflux pump subunit AcrB